MEILDVLNQIKIPSVSVIFMSFHESKTIILIGRSAVVENLVNLVYDD